MKHLFYKSFFFVVVSSEDLTSRDLVLLFI